MDPTRWTAIVEAAVPLFARFGYKKTTMDDVAAAAGVAKGTLYLGCSSKRDLFYQAVLHEMARWNARVARRIDPGRPADELLVECVEYSLAIMDEHPLARDTVMGVYDADLPDWLDRLDELRGRGLANVLEILRLGVRQQRFRPELPSEEVGNIILDLITTTIMYLTRTADAEARIAARQRVIFQLLLDGLRVPTPS